MAIVGIAKVRDEVHILKDTLDNWAQYCDAGIHVYVEFDARGCPHHVDMTACIAREHPAVREVITSNLIDPDRERAEAHNRQVGLSSALRFIGPGDWVAYFDGDEHLYAVNPDVFQAPHFQVIAAPMIESYVTPEDAELSEFDYAQRRWCGDEYEYSPLFFRHSPYLGFHHRDQRNMSVDPRLKTQHHAFMGKCRHWGKGLSVKKWEEKCHYYAEVFGPKYAEKWRKRMGHAVHTLSDFGRPLVLWDDILHDRAPIIWRRELELVS